MNKNAPLILLGSQRSGTTVLSYALSEAFSLKDGIFTVNGKVMYFLNRWLTKTDLEARHFRADEIMHSMLRRTPGGNGIDRWLEQVERVLRQAALEVADGLHCDEIALGRKIIRDCYAGYTRWGDKYNEYLNHISYLEDILPDARYILLFRPPYEIAASVLEWTGDRPWRPSTFEGNLNKWAAWHHSFFELLETLPENRYQVIEYHSLCAGEETKRLSEFVGLNLEPHLRNLVPRRPILDRPSLPKNTEDIWIRLQGLRKAQVQV